MATVQKTQRGPRKATPKWVAGMRENLRIECGRGWRITEVSGRIFLTVQHADGQRSTLQTSLPWAKTSQPALIKVAADLQIRMTEHRLGLRQAYELITQNEKITTSNGQDWAATVTV